MTDVTDLGARLKQAGLVRRVATGEAVFAQGDVADGAYVVLSGQCLVLEGSEQVNVLHQGQLFGEIGALGSEARRTASVVAAVDSELLFLSLDQLREGFASAPELLWQSLRLVVERLQQITVRQVAYREEHLALREVQRSLLPNVAGFAADGLDLEAVWSPCTYASGDYYDVIRLDADRHLLAVGDVMGHGAEASLMMAVARAQIRELARSFRRTDELLLQLDGYLRDNAPPKQGMSLVVAVYSRGERLLEYSSAGHPFPLLHRAGEMSDLPGRPGLLLALPFIVGVGYERCMTELEPGDQLLLFTDGLMEVPVDADGTLLRREGLSRLAGQILPRGGPGSLDELVAAVTAVDAGPAPDDDRTALLLRVT